MLAIKLYDIGTGHVETLIEVASEDAARRWLDTFQASGVGTNDVAYVAEVRHLVGADATVLQPWGGS